MGTSLKVNGRSVFAEDLDVLVAEVMAVRPGRLHCVAVNDGDVPQVAVFLDDQRASEQDPAISACITARCGDSSATRPPAVGGSRSTWRAAADNQRQATAGRYVAAVAFGRAQGAPNCWRIAIGDTTPSSWGRCVRCWRRLTRWPSYPMTRPCISRDRWPRLRQRRLRYRSSADRAGGPSRP